MEIVEQIKEHSVTDYDFVFSSGSKLAITVDHDAGDTAIKHPDRFEFHIAGKPSQYDPEDSVDEQDMTVYIKQLAFVAVCNRKQRMPTEEEKLESQRFIHQLAKSVQ